MINSACSVFLLQYNNWQEYCLSFSDKSVGNCFLSPFGGSPRYVWLLLNFLSRGHFTYISCTKFCNFFQSNSLITRNDSRLACFITYCNKVLKNCLLSLILNFQAHFTDLWCFAQEIHILYMALCVLHAHRSFWLCFFFLRFFHLNDCFVRCF